LKHDTPDYSKIRNQVRKYLKAGQKNHTPKIDQPDISHAHRMSTRIEKFDLGLESISAHTLKIIEIIEEEKNMIEMKNQEKIKQKLDGLKNNG